MRHISARPGLKVVLGLAWLIGLSACSAPAASSDPNAIVGKFDVGGRSLYLECHGSGGPTVVMDAGLGNTHATWSAVAPQLAKLARTCTYDRANIGMSDTAPTPRSSADVVADLQALLNAARGNRLGQGGRCSLFDPAAECPLDR